MRGSVNIPATCAGALVHPDGVVIADDDGIVVLPAAAARQIADAAHAREENGTQERAKFAAGVLGSDRDNVRMQPERAGLGYIDRALRAGRGAKVCRCTLPAQVGCLYRRLREYLGIVYC